jgi:hypothetical protein
MKRLILLLAISLPVLANPTTLFTRYEAIRQGLLGSSLSEAKKSAAVLAADANKAKLATIADCAQSIAVARELTDARRSFGALSDEMIKLRNTTKGARPSVYYCPMVKKSWLQAKGQVGNPYDSTMALCGELKAE